MLSRQNDTRQRAEAQIRRLFGDDTPVDNAVAWAHAELADAGISASRSPLRAAKRLRRNRSGLTRLSARYLVDRVADRRWRDPRDDTWRDRILM